MKFTDLVRLPYEYEKPAPSFGDEEIKYPESLVRHFLSQYTKPGEKSWILLPGLAQRFLSLRK